MSNLIKEIPRLWFVWNSIGQDLRPQVYRVSLAGGEGSAPSPAEKSGLLHNVARARGRLSQLTRICFQSISFRHGRAQVGPAPRSWD